MRESEAGLIYKLIRANVANYYESGGSVVHMLLCKGENILCSRLKSTFESRSRYFLDLLPKILVPHMPDKIQPLET